MDFRVNISKSSQAIYKGLTGSGSVFPQFSDMFFWCVVLAYSNKLDRKPILKKEGVFEWKAFDTNKQIPVLKMIAVAEHGDFSILDKDNTESINTFRDIIEQYSEAGLSLLLEKFDEQNMITSDALFSLLVAEIKKVKKSK